MSLHGTSLLIQRLQDWLDGPKLHSVESTLQVQLLMRECLHQITVGAASLEAERERCARIAADFSFTPLSSDIAQRIAAAILAEDGPRT